MHNNFIKVATYMTSMAGSNDKLHTGAQIA